MVSPDASSSHREVLGTEMGKGTLVFMDTNSTMHAMNEEPIEKNHHDDDAAPHHTSVDSPPRRKKKRFRRIRKRTYATGGVFLLALTTLALLFYPSTTRPEQELVAASHAPRVKEKPRLSLARKRQGKPLRVAAPRINAAELRLSWQSLSGERQLIERYAERADRPIDFLKVPYRTGRTRLVQNEDVDVAIGRIPIDDLPDDVLPSAPIERMHRVLLTRSDIAPSPKSDLSGLKIVIHEDEPLRDELEAREGLQLDVLESDTPRWVLAAQVLRHKADGMLAWEDHARSILSKHPGLMINQPVGDRIPVGWVIQKEERELRGELNGLIAQSVLSQDLAGALFGDLDDIKDRGVLRVLVPHGPRSFFIHRGERFGRDYELARRLAESLDVKLRVILPPSNLSLDEALTRGLVDMVVGFPVPLQPVQENFNYSTSYADSRPRELAFVLSPEMLEQMVQTQPPKPIDLVIATRGSDAKLAAHVQDFVEAQSSSGELSALVARYEKLDEEEAREKEEEENSSSPYDLSDFDELIRDKAHASDFDWRLIAAQAFQESSFDPDARSWAGATGLMQLMPSTAKWLGVKGDLTDPEVSLEAGIEYMSWLADMYEDQGLPPDEVIRFALASYNAGQGHVEDARLVAQKIGRDPDKWYGHVEHAITLLSERQYAKDVRYGYCRCTEVVNYVKKIESRYLDYVTYLDQIAMKDL